MNLSPISYSTEFEVNKKWDKVCKGLALSDRDATLNKLRDLKLTLHHLELTHKALSSGSQIDKWYLNKAVSFTFLGANISILYATTIATSIDAFYQNNADCERPVYLIVLLVISSVAISIFGSIKGFHTYLKKGLQKRNEEIMKNEKAYAEILSDARRSLKKFLKTNDKIYIKKCLIHIRLLPPRFTENHPELSELTAFLFSLTPPNDPARITLDELKRIADSENDNMAHNSYLKNEEADELPGSMALRRQNSQNDCCRLWNSLDLPDFINEFLWHNTLIKKPEMLRKGSVYININPV